MLDAREREIIGHWLQAADADTLARQGAWPWRYARDVRLLLEEVDRLLGLIEATEATNEQGA